MRNCCISSSQTIELLQAQSKKTRNSLRCVTPTCRRYVCTSGVLCSYISIFWQPPADRTHLPAARDGEPPGKVGISSWTLRTSKEACNFIDIQREGSNGRTKTLSALQTTAQWTTQSLHRHGWRVHWHLSLLVRTPHDVKKSYG